MAEHREGNGWQPSGVLEQWNECVVRVLGEEIGVGQDGPRAGASPGGFFMEDPG